MRRKGIEPIVSVVLLLLITIALAGGVLVWLTGYVGGLQGDFTTKGTSCQRINASGLVFRGYLVNTQDSPITPSSITIAQLGGPTSALILEPASLPETQLAPGAQALFTIDASKPTGTAVARGTYTVELAGKAIEKVAFNCP